MTKGNNSQNIDARVTYLMHDTFSYQGLPIYEVSEMELLDRHEKVTKGNNSKNINARVKDFVLTLPLIKVYSSMKFNFISICKT